MFGETKPSFFKRKGMPTPDASQFTQLKKYSAVAGIGAQGQGQKRTVTRTTQPLPSVLRPLNFLSSFSNKVTSGTSFVPINRVTGLQAKTKVPGGHVFGDSAGPNPSGISNSFNFSGSYGYWGPGQSSQDIPCNYRTIPGDTVLTFNNDTGATQTMWRGPNGLLQLAIPTGSYYTINISPLHFDSLSRKCPLPDGGGTGGTGPTYDETTVTDSSFMDDEVIIDKSITANSPFTYNLYDRIQRYGYYFDLNSLSSDYTYTFEISDDSINAIIALFNTQDKALINNYENDIIDAPGILEDNDAGVGAGDESKKLSDKIITGNWCLVVSSYFEQVTGTFTLKITRTLKSGGGTGPTYETPVDDSSFMDDEVIFNKSITANSPFRYYEEEGGYGHYFNLNGLSSDYIYTFETTAASLSDASLSYASSDTIIALFNTQDRAQINDGAANISEDYNDDGDYGRFSKLYDQIITGNWCLVVSSSNEQQTGTFTLKITRTPPGGLFETIVDDSNFITDEVIFNKSITTNSPFTYNLFRGSLRYGHYFNLNGLSSDYIYTFQTTAASLSDGSSDTIIALFNTQDKARMTGDAPGILVASDDDGGDVDRSKLSGKIITGNWCLVVSSRNEQQTGTCRLKITRTLKSGGGGGGQE